MEAPRLPRLVGDARALCDPTGGILRRGVARERKHPIPMARGVRVSPFRGAGGASHDRDEEHDLAKALMASLVAQHGVEYLFATVVLMGLIQLFVGVMRWGTFIRLVPHPVMLGFVNGLAIVSFLAQMSQFQVPGSAEVTRRG